MRYNTEECKELANELGVKVAFLFSCLELTNNQANYKNILINKRDGTKRTIVEPHEKIKTIQKRIVTFLKTKQSEKYCAYGFVKGKSNIKNAKVHLHKKFVYKIDLKDYFPSIQSGRIYKMLMSEPFSFSNCYAVVITNLLCCKNLLYQGAPSSPFIANLITRKLDNAMLKLATDYKCNYTRYADDMTFSTDLSIFPLELSNKVKSIIEKEMFTVNEKKTKLQCSNMRQMVTGIVVNEKLNLKRSYYRELRVLLYAWKTKGITICAEKNNMSEAKLKRYVLGKMAYYKSVVSSNNDCYLRMCDLYNKATDTNYFSVPIVYKLSNASHILKGGDIKPAGNSAADVLEEFLKQLGLTNGILQVMDHRQLKNINDATIDPIKAELKKQNIIDNIQAKEIEKLAAIRKLCNHSTTQIPKKEDIETLIKGTYDLISAFYK